MSVSVLVLCEIAPAQQAFLTQHYRPSFAVSAAQRAEIIQSRGAEFDAVLTIGLLGLSADEMDALPKLRLIACMGAGFERVDVAAAHARGITVTNGRGANDECVADHAMGMLIATMRDFRALDRLCRAGVWRTAIPLPPNVSGKRLGILGMGAVGERIARRAQAFNMQIGYHNRRARPAFDYTYFDDLAALARWCDVLVCAAPGGKDTEHLVNASVLDALGSAGVSGECGPGQHRGYEGFGGRPAVRTDRRRRAGCVRERTRSTCRADRPGPSDPVAARGRLVAGSGRGAVQDVYPESGQCVFGEGAVDASVRWGRRF